nr:ABC transporter ATP-binding protein [Clostridium sp. CM74B_53]
MKRQKECFIGVSAVVHLFLKIAGAMPVVFLLFLVVNVLHGTAWALETLARQVFFDGLQSAVERNSLQAAYSGALWVGAAAVYVQVLNGAGNFIGQHIFNPRAVNTLTREFHTQTAQLPLYEFEKETTLETIEKARQGINGTVQLLRAVISIAMFNLPYVAFMGVYLYRLDPILVLSLLFIFSPMVCAQVIKRKAYRRLTDETAALEREYRHYSDCMIDKRYWKETRTLGAVGFFMERFRAVLAKYDKKLWETDSRLYRTELLMRVLTLLGYLGVLFLLVRSLLSGNISAGAFAAVFTSIDSIFRFMENIVARSAGNISRHMASVGNYLEFCRQNGFAADDGQVRGASDGCCIAEESESGRESCAVIVEDVSFAYPNADRPFLDRISVRIRKGETVAVVGENGAGKNYLRKACSGTV